MSKYKHEKQFMFSQKKLRQVQLFLKDVRERKNVDITIIKDDKQNTVLHQCSYQGSLAILKQYVAYVKQFWSYSIYNYNKQYFIQKQKQQNQKLKQWINLRNKQGYTALHYAAYKGYVDIIDYLYYLGANYEMKTNSGLKILHLAAQNDKVKTFIYFRGKLNINQPDQKGSTPLHWASYSASQKVTEYLLCQNSNKPKGHKKENKQKPNEKDGQTKFKQNLTIDINAQDCDGQTPLHLATSNGNTKIVRRLLIAGANRHIKNHQLQQPIDIAKQNQFFTIQNFLNDKYNWLDYIKFFLNIKIKYQPKSRSMKMPLIFIIFSLFLIAFITLGLKYHDQYILILYIQSGAFLFLLLLYLSLIVEPKRLQRGKYKSIILKNIQKLSNITDQTVVSSRTFTDSSIDTTTQIQSICLRCVQFKPTRSHHCDICNTCIEQYDHHCPWINNCVGKRNLKRFLLFLVMLFIVLNWIIIITVQFVMVIANDEDDQVAFFQLQGWVKDNQIILYAYVCITTFLYLFFVIPLLFLIFVQILNLLLGKTTYQRFSKANQSILSRSERQFMGNNSGNYVKRKQKISCMNCLNMCYSNNEQNKTLFNQ